MEEDRLNGRGVGEEGEDLHFSPEGWAEAGAPRTCERGVPWASTTAFVAEILPPR